MLRTKEYEQYLWGCRFCPMCKPVSDVANATFLESHATRAHAMIIWRVSNGIKDYTDKEIELLYQTNLDSVSEAFCVDHYAVSSYLLAARQDIVDAGRAPKVVCAVFERAQEIRVSGATKGGAAILCSEALSFGYQEAVQKVSDVAKKLGAGVIAGYSGVDAYVLGNTKKALADANDLVKAIADSGVQTIVADGTETWYALTKLYPEIGVTLPQGVKVVNMAEFAFASKDVTKSDITGKDVFVHDARASYFLREGEADEKVIMPDFFGPEELLGAGKVYETIREIVDKMGAVRKFSVWSRALAKSMGMDEALYLTYPDLAAKIAAVRLKHIAEIGAQYIVTDSLATVLFLENTKPEGSENIKPIWLPQLI